MQISPGIAHSPSRLCLSDIRRSVPYKYRALMIMDISPRYAASYPLPVRQASALPSASSRFAVAHDTLAVQLTLPLVGRVEDFHLQVSAPCRAHHQKKPLPSGGFTSTRFISTLTLRPSENLTHPLLTIISMENIVCYSFIRKGGLPCPQPLNRPPGSQRRQPC